MTGVIVAIAADHAGYELKQELAAELKAMGYDILDLGTDSAARVDYPDFADAMAGAIRDGRAEKGVLVCGSGIGISMAANRHREIRAAPCYDEETARLARGHNDADVLALGARLIDLETAKTCLRTFFSTEFEGGRHAGRVAKMS